MSYFKFSPIISLHPVAKMYSRSPHTVTVSIPNDYLISIIEDPIEKEAAILAKRMFVLKAAIADKKLLKELDNAAKYFPGTSCYSFIETRYNNRMSRRAIEKVNGFVVPPGRWDDDLDARHMPVKYPVELSAELTALGYKAFAKRNGIYWTWSGYVELPKSHPVRLFRNEFCFDYDRPKDMPAPPFTITFLSGGIVGFDHATTYDISPTNPFTDLGNEFWRFEPTGKGYIDFAGISKEIQSLADYLYIVDIWKNIGKPSDPAPASAPAPAPAPAPEPAPPIIGFEPTSWINSDGVDFNSQGRKVAYGNGKWIAVGVDSTNTIKGSTDGITWFDVDNQMPYTVSSTGVFGVATDGNGNWVAVGNKNTQANAKTILYSSDNGVTWNSNSSYDSGFNLNNGFTDRGWGVAYGNGIWMAVGHYNTTPIGYERNVKVATSFDPITGPNWSNSPPGTGRNDVFGLSNPAICVAYGNGTWCIGGQDLNATPKGSIFYSTNNGTSWTKATNSFKGQCMGIATDGNNNWVAVGSPKSGSDLRPIKYSTDNGITWIDTTTPSASLFSMGNSVSYVQTSSGNVWVAAGSGNSRTILISTDNGITWSSGGSNTFTFNAYGVAYGDDKWVAVGDGGAASIRYSSN